MRVKLEMRVGDGFRDVALFGRAEDGRRARRIQKGVLLADVPRVLDELVASLEQELAPVAPQP